MTGAVHALAHQLAGQAVTVISGSMAGAECWVEDWWDRLAGGSWMDATGNPACLAYAVRSATDRLPVDNEVVYGRVGDIGHLIHASELGGVVR